jgi:hypothetical protein
MKRRCVIALLTLSSLFGRYAFADTTPATPDPDIAPEIKADAANHADEIGQAIRAELGKMVQQPTDPNIINAGREWLIKAGSFNDGASAQYQSVYTDQLNKAFTDLLNKPSTPASVRLNMAVLIPKLTVRVVNLAPVVVKLLEDKSVVVVLRAEGAAQFLLEAGMQPPGFNAGDRDLLLDAIVKSIANHPNPPVEISLAEQAYKAIYPPLYPPNDYPTGGDLVALISANLKLQEARLKIYQTALPENPYADTFASGFLIGSENHPEVWKAMTVDQQTQSIQQSADLVAMACQRLQGSNEELVRAIQAEGKWLGIVNKTVLNQDAGTADAAEQLQKVSAGTAPEDVRKLSDSLQLALRTAVTNAGLPALKDAVNLDQPGSTPTGAAAAQ